jgi:hypothetical protein
MDGCKKMTLETSSLVAEEDQDYYGEEYYAEEFEFK